MQAKRHSAGNNTSKSSKKTVNSHSQRMEIFVIWFVVTLILLSLIAIGAVLYVTTETQDRGNCTSVGGEMVYYGDRWVCMDTDGIGGTQ